MALCYNVKEVVYLLHALISVRTFIMAIIDNGHLMAIKWPLKFLKAILPIYSVHVLSTTSSLLILSIHYFYISTSSTTTGLHDRSRSSSTVRKYSSLCMMMRAMTSSPQR